MNDCVNEVVVSVSKANTAELSKMSEQDRKTTKGIDSRTIASRHVLDFLPLNKSAIRKVTIKALEERIRDGIINDLDSVDLNEVLQVPTFSHIRQDPSGTSVYNRGWLVIGYTLLNDKILKTFYNIFDDDTRRRVASLGQRCAVGLKNYISTHTDGKTNRLIESFTPINPLYDEKNVVANIFLDGMDLHSTLQTLSPDQKYEHVRITSIHDILLHHHSKEFFRTREGKRYAKGFTTRDHTEKLRKRVFGDRSSNGEFLPGQRIINALAIDSDDIGFSHGDAQPANMIVKSRKRDPLASEILQSDTEYSYTPIDFEFACLDVPLASIVQRMIKSGIYQYDGTSITLANGKSLEEQLINDIVAIQKKQNPTVDVMKITEQFSSLKAENYLLWASRYLELSRGVYTKNKDASLLLATYFHTLFAKELVKQGKATSLDDAIFEDTKDRFSHFATDDELKRIFETYHPDSHSLSVLKADFTVPAEERLKEAQARYRQKTWLGRIAKAVMVVCAVGTIGLTSRFYKDTVKLGNEVQEHTIAENYAKKLRIIRIYQLHGEGLNFEEGTSLKEIKAWSQKLGDDRLAFAAFINYDSTYAAIQSNGGKTNYDEVWRKLINIDEPLYLALLETQYCVDNWMRSYNGPFSPEALKFSTKKVEELMAETEKRYRTQKEQERLLANKLDKNLAYSSPVSVDPAGRRSLQEVRGIADALITR